MSWIQATWVVDAQLVEPLTEMLETFLAQSVTCENAGEDEFYEVAFPGTPDWLKVKVTGLFQEDVPMQEIIEFVHSHLPASGESMDSEIPVSVSKLVDQDWQRIWLKSFTPIEVGRNLWVCPSWCEPMAPQARNIILDPGLAFGTGTHATTHMCLDWLSSQDLSGQKVLDYGSGSGILAIAALLSKASLADAVDIDPLAVDACRENARRNKFERKMRAYLPSHLPAGQYQLVIANILAEVIIELRDKLLLHLAPRGTLLLTGILNSQADQVVHSFGDNFKFQQTVEDQWCLLIGSSTPEN